MADNAPSNDPILDAILGNTAILGLLMKVLVDKDIISPQEMHQRLSEMANVAATADHGRGPVQKVSEMVALLEMSHPQLRDHSSS